MEQLSVHLVTWNGGKYIPYLFASLRNQTYTNWKLYIWDNASSDDTYARITHELSSVSFPHESFLAPENSGFAGGHNQLYQKTKAPYFLLLNQDMYLSPDCFARMIAYMEGHPHVAAVSPRLMRWDMAMLQSGEASSLEKSFTPYIDSLGLSVSKNRRVLEQYTAQEWTSVASQLSFSPESKSVLPVFGVSGAFPLLRRQSIETIAFTNNTFLDALYHSYKEDVDLAFRLRRRGYEAAVLLDTVAYHDRSAAGPKELSDAAARENKQKQSNWVKVHSYKNHLMTLYKNEYWQNVVLDFPAIFWYELKKFVYFLLYDRAVLQGLLVVWKYRKDIQKSKKHIHDHTTASWRDLREWWT